MPQTDPERWNQRYLTGEFAFREPDAFVTEAHENFLLPLLPAGSAGLDLAGGAGHHAIWLAQHAWRMTLVDWSGVALEIARQQASEAEVQGLEMLQGSVLDIVQRFHTERRRFGFILVSFFLDRAVLPFLPKLLLPGGLLLYRIYTVDNVRLGNPRGPRDPEYLLQSQELLKTFREIRILHYHETVVAKGIVELIAQREAD